MNKVTIVLSGKKQSGKSTTCMYIAARFINQQTKSDIYSVNEKGELLYKGMPYHTQTAVNDIIAEYDVKVYSFADPLKRFCIDVLGAPEEGCYGTDEQKNAPIEHLMWENLPLGLRPGEGDFLDVSFGGGHTVYEKYKCGNLSGRELMQTFGTNICRSLYYDCWARGTFNSIPLALICDGRFPNEINMGNTLKAKTVRLLRAPHVNDQHPSETALDDFPLDQYSYVLDNREMSLEEHCQVMDSTIDEWLSSCF
jgi:hypothetical protein